MLCHSGVLQTQQVHLTTFTRTTRAWWAPVLSLMAAAWWRCTCTAPPSARWTIARTPRSSRHSTNLSRLTLSQNYQMSLSKLSIGGNTLEAKFINHDVIVFKVFLEWDRPCPQGSRGGRRHCCCDCEGRCQSRSPVHWVSIRVEFKTL